MIEAWAGNRRMTQKNRHLGANNPLGENRELLDLIQEAGRLGMCEYDLASGIATRTPYHDQIFGYQELQPVWTFETFLGHVLPEDRRKVDELFKHAVTSSSAIDLECRIRRIQGDVRWVWIQAKTRTDDRGKTVGLFGLIRDITDRKNTEEALRKSEALLRETQAISKTGGWEIDLSTGRVYWTDEVYRIFELPFGHDPSDIQSDLSLFSPESRPVMMHAMKRIVEQGEPYDLELEIVRPKGEKRWVRTIARPVVENNRMVRIAGNLMDITDRKLAELQLQENERNLRVMSDNSPLLIWVCDAEGRLEFVNRTMLEYYGLSQERITGHRWVDLVHPDDVEGFLETFTHALDGRKPFRGRSRVRSGSNEWRWVETIGTPRFSVEGDFLGMVGTSQDITERVQADMELRAYRDRLEDLVKERTRELEEKSARLEAEILDRGKAEQEIRRSEEQYRLVVENANEGIIIAQNGMFRLANRKVSEILGYSQDELMSRSFIDFVHPDDRQMVMDRHRRRMAGREAPSRYLFRAVAQSGATRWLSIGAVMVSWEGRPATLNFLTDITERIEMEEEKKRMEAQLAQAQKIEALGTFAGGIAHDLNNILYPIIINIELLLAEAEEGTETHETLGQILTAAQRGRDLVKQILTFSRKSDQRMAPVEVGPLMKETMSLLRSSLPSTIELSSRIEDGLPPVMGDATQIQQIVLNLCRNAADSLQSLKGTIGVKLSRTRIEPGPKDKGLQPGEYLVLSVEDNGKGIRPENLDRVFEPFFTTKEVGKGIGMGLPVALGVAKRHGGTITAQSRIDKGSVFTVYLPAMAEDARLAPDPVQEPRLDRKASILLVDDEEAILSSMRRALERSGYSVTCAAGGREAFDLFSRAPDAFDLVITDLSMPGMDGQELTRRLLRIRPGTRVILSTGYGDVVTEEEAHALGIGEILLKPPDTGELNAAVERALKG